MPLFSGYVFPLGECCVGIVRRLEGVVRESVCLCKSERASQRERERERERDCIALSGNFIMNERSAKRECEPLNVFDLS